MGGDGLADGANACDQISSNQLPDSAADPEPVIGPTPSVHPGPKISALELSPLVVFHLRHYQTRYPEGGVCCKSPGRP